MKIIFELIMPVLGLSICILSAQIPAVSWTNQSPFYYFVPQSPHQPNNIAVRTSFALESDSPIIEKLGMTHPNRELSPRRMGIAQSTTKSNLHYAIKNAEKILSNLQMTTKKFAAIRLEMDDIKTKLNQTNSAVEATNIELNATKLEMDDMKSTLNQTSFAVEATNIALNATKFDIDDTKTKLNQTRTSVEATNIELNIAKLEMDIMKTKLNQTNLAVEATNIELNATKAEVDDTKTRLNQTNSFVEATNIELNVTKLEMDIMKTILNQTNLAVEATNIELRAAKSEMDNTKIKLNQTSSAVEATNIELSATKLHLDNVNTTVEGIYSNLLKLTQAFGNEIAVVDIGHMPESCTDLKTIGYKMNGVFQIKGKNEKKQIETVYCNFSATIAEDFQKWIGYVDVKSAPVNFYVQRNSSFATTNTPIPFELAVINEGNAMNLTSGIFTAPRPGIYFFSFTGLAQFINSTNRIFLQVGLYLNGSLIGSGHVDEQNTIFVDFSQLTLQSTQNLKKGDEVWLVITYISRGVILVEEIGRHFTHFTGFMLEEEIFASL